MTAWLYLGFSMLWTPCPTPSVELGPLLEVDKPAAVLKVSPLVLTWTPEEGFGARSDVEVYSATP